MSRSVTRDDVRDWILKKGVLYVLTQLPMIQVVIGYFWRWTTYPIITGFTLLPAFIVLPVWIGYRRRVSDDPTEPAHHFGTYALWALIPYVVYNFVRIPAHYSLDIVFWDHWYDYGFELTGEPVDHWMSLSVGTVIHSLQGFVLALGFFILFSKITLLRALLYVWVLLSAIYIWFFPRYVLVDFQPPAKWYFLAIWAHFWMAITAYFMPKLYVRRAPRTRRRTLTAILGAVALVAYVFPVLFVFWRAGNWQFPVQKSIDEATFDRVAIWTSGGPVLTSHGSDGISPESVFEFTLRFGPRPYKDYIKATKALDAGPVEVTGSIRNAVGDPIAFCSTSVRKLETPNNITSPRLYFPALREMVHTDIPVECFGDAMSAETLPDGVVSVGWEAEVTLLGDRETMSRSYEGSSRPIALQIAEGVTVPGLSLIAATAEQTPGGEATELEFGDYVDRTLKRTPVVTTSEIVVMSLGALLMLIEIAVLWPSRHKRMDRFVDTSPDEREPR